MKILGNSFLIFMLVLIMAGCLPSDGENGNSTSSSNSTESEGSNSSEPPTNDSDDITEASHDYLALYVNKAVDIDGWGKFESQSTEPAEVIVEFDEDRMIATITLLSGEGRLVRVAE